MRDIGPHSRPHVLAKLDGRTKEARLLQQTREDLTEYVGGTPTMAEKALIERAAMLKLQIALMDAKTLEAGEVMSERNGREYLSWTNTFMKILKSLTPAKSSGKAKAAAPVSLEEYIARRKA